MGNRTPFQRAVIQFLAPLESTHSSRRRRTMLRLILVAALVALATADKVYQCMSTYQESNVPACTGYDWPGDYQMMCSKDDILKGDESAYFTVADDVVPMCYTWVLQYKARDFIPGGPPEKRQAMFLWRGANLQRKRKSCELACSDVRAYANALGDEYKTVFFSCSFMENDNKQDVSKYMLAMSEPSSTACVKDTEYDKPSGDQRPPQSAEIGKPDPIDPEWGSAIMIVQIVLIVIALVLVAAGLVVFFLFKSALSATD